MPSGAFLAAAVAVGTVVPANQARADCGFEVAVKNESPDAFTVVKIATSNTVVKVYKKQWEGSRVIAAGATETFTFTVDICPSSTARLVKVFYTSAGNPTTYQDVEQHRTSETQSLK
jgi:hypothetical protein